MVEELSEEVVVEQLVGGDAMVGGDMTADGDRMTGVMPEEVMDMDVVGNLPMMAPPPSLEELL